MADVIVILIIVGILSAAIAKIVKEKRSGAKCIGCPDGKSGCCHCDDSKKVFPKTK